MLSAFDYNTLWVADDNVFFKIPHREKEENDFLPIIAGNGGSIEGINISYTGQTEKQISECWKINNWYF